MARTLSRRSGLAARGLLRISLRIREAILAKPDSMGLRGASNYPDETNTDSANGGNRPATERRVIDARSQVVPATLCASILEAVRSGRIQGVETGVPFRLFRGDDEMTAPIL